MTSISRRAFGLGVAGLACAHSPLLAQPAYPSRPVRLMVGFTAGGSADATARILAAEMSGLLGQQMIVENRTGATGNLATQAVVQAAPDGHTVKFAQIHLATNPWLQDVGYDPERDLTMVTQVVDVPVLLLAKSTSSHRSLDDLVAAAKARPGELNFGGVIGTSSHLAVEILAQSAGFTYTFVPYRGGADAVQALSAGQVDFVFDLMSPVIRSNIEAGQLRPIAVMQDEPVAGLPAAVPAGRQGYGAATYFRSWQGLAVRSGTPAHVIERLHQAAKTALAKPEVRTRLVQLGAEPKASEAPAEFQAHYMAELRRMGELLRRLGLARR